MGHFVIWTDEQSEALRAFIADGMTYRECAQAINERFNVSFSRNAVIGRGKRIGVSAPAKPPPKNPPRPTLLPRHARRTRQAPRPIVEMKCDAIEPLHLDLLDLDRHHCRWPYGEGSNITFCGHSKMVGSYCLAHFQLSVGPGTASERAAV